MMAWFRVWMRQDRLDRELADGCPPEMTPDHARRSRRLTSPRTRRQLAASLRRSVSVAQRAPTAGLFSAVPVDRDAVEASREGLLGLADALDRLGPGEPCGLARLNILLTDGSGPLYSSQARPPLSAAIWWVADGLSPHSEQTVGAGSANRSLR